jgi:hypothetical protein
VRVACPDCTNPIEAAPGEEVVCPACFTRFEAPSSAQVPRRFDVHFPDGSVQPRQSLYAVREAIYAGRIPITARLRPDVGAEELVPVYGFPWFAQIYALLGVEPPANAGTRRIAGWQGVKKGKAAPPERPGKAAARPAAGPRPGAGSPAWLPFAVGGAVLLLGALAVAALVVREL